MAPQDPPISSAAPLTAEQQKLVSRMAGRLRWSELQEKTIATRRDRQEADRPQPQQQEGRS